MKAKVNNDEYISINEFTSDIKLLVNNCLTFNMDTPINLELRNSAKSLLQLYTDEFLPPLEKQIQGIVIIIIVEEGEVVLIPVVVVIVL